jgi:maltooligosyltrehalose trehalohydrolase
MQRRWSVGPEVRDDGVHFRVWAPARSRVAVVIGERDYPLAAENGGYFGGLVAEARAGDLYRFRLDDENETYPDPASRYQPDGPHGASAVLAPHALEGRLQPAKSSALNIRPAEAGPPKGIVISEIHFGTFTPEGTFVAAIDKLQLLAEVGITMLELMPVNEFPGRFGWGYDGVDLWAPARLYGTPGDFRRFIDEAHALGLAVILDVVYNHFGPDGCYLQHFAPDYFTDRYKNEWGEAINFDGPNAHGARTFIAENAAYWIDEYRLDGLRIDATQSIFDASEKHILREITDLVRERAGEREVLLLAENEPQDVAIIEKHGLDAMWNDDWHHAARVALTGFREAYYSDYRGRAQEFVSMAKLGFLYQGQWYSWQRQRRGTPSFHHPPARFVCSLENHDQVANSADGARLSALTSPVRLRAMTALLLLQPQIPMLFQGQEFGSTKPFLYFADHEPELAENVRKGRHEFLTQFPSIDARALALPHAPETFAQCKLDWSERDEHAEIVALHRDLIALRRAERVLDGAVLGEQAFVLRWEDRLLVVNLGAALELDPVVEPLLAPPSGFETWSVAWSSEDQRYGGKGTAGIEIEKAWTVPAECALLLSSMLSCAEITPRT